MIGKEDIRYFVPFKNLNTLSFIYDDTLQCGRKHFLQSSSTAGILKSHVTDCFKINGKQMIKILKRFDSKI